MRSIATFVLAVLLAAPIVLLPSRAAFASGLPAPQYCSVGHGITLGGASALGVDPLTTKTISVRNIFDDPLQHATVVIDFSACVNGGDVRLCANQPDPGIAVSCGTRSVSAVTDANGIATFHLVGSALNPGGGTLGAPAPGFGANGARVLANGVMLGSLTVAAFDQDGEMGVNGADLARFLNDRFSFDPGTPATTLRGRSDYNADGKVDVLDLAMLLRARFAGGSSESCASACP